MTSEPAGVEELMSLSRVVFKSATDEWSTPDDVYQSLHSEFKFQDDPCPMGGVWDGLYRSWKSPAFVNPPYSDLRHWTKKAYEEWGQGVQSVLLIPSRTDTRWWHDYVMKATEIRFIKGRLKFGGSKTGAPFPSCVVVFA